MPVTLTIDPRFRGPPESGNGGYVAGMLARHIGKSAVVTLRKPVPLGRPLDVITANGAGVALHDGAVRIAEADPAPVEAVPRPAVTFDQALAARSGSRLRRETHPLPSCFVCGPDRPDGLRLAAGPVSSGDSLAAPWLPDHRLAGEDGCVASEYIWAAMDCPTGFAAIAAPQSGCDDGALMLLGRMAARVDRPPRTGEKCVVMSWFDRADGRKLFAGGAVYGAAGDLCAVAANTWITVSQPINVQQEDR